MKFVWFDKTQKEYEIITSILNKEKVLFRTERERDIQMCGFFGIHLKTKYQIEVDVTLEYWDYLNKLVEERTKLFNSFDLPSLEHPPVSEETKKESSKLQTKLDKLYEKQMKFAAIYGVGVRRPECQ